jgi:phosphatidylserine decarboxylase
MGWFSQIRQPLVRRASIAAWKLLADLDLSDAKKQRFESLHDCFNRELKPGARPVDVHPTRLTSPCDAIVGACGEVDGDQTFQAKGFPYTLTNPFGARAAEAAEVYRDGCYATLRLTSSMYHRFDAPQDCSVQHLTYHSGDTWNVNPVELARVERLFGKNERAVIHITLEHGAYPFALARVAAILVACIRLRWLDTLLHLRCRRPHELPGGARFAKGQEIGWFQHGSTILVFAPRGFSLAAGIAPAVASRMGQALMALPEAG